MSQSPLKTNGDRVSLDSYRKGWKALNRLLHENKSFSGRETNNAFFNMGAAKTLRFADVSSAIGWDFADDARAIAQIDWDHDGDLDLWVTNRTAPRLRLLENLTSNSAHSVSFLLEGNGKTVNRDAIGAQVYLYLTGETNPLIRSLHAGHSFLSQQSRFLHFGLGPDNKIEKVIVKWPDRRKEEFTSVSRRGRFLLRQHDGVATPLSARHKISLKAQEQTPRPIETLARIIPPPGHTLPRVVTQNGPLEWHHSTTFLQLWSPSCPHCLEHLSEWKNQENLILLATEDDLISQEKTRQLFQDHDFEHAPLFATTSTMQALDSFQSSLVDLWVPLPVPSGFLVTSENEVLAVYRGAVDAKTVKKDTLLANTVDRRSSATPFEGRWISEQPAATPLRTANQLTSRGLAEEAISYLQSALKSPSSKIPKTQLADCYLMLGQQLGIARKAQEAIAPLKKAFELLPQDIRISLLLATAYQESGNLHQAYQINSYARKIHSENLDLLQQQADLAYLLKMWPASILAYQQLIKINPQPAFKIRLALSHVENAQPKNGITILKNSLREDPRYLASASQLSRILSTHPDAEIRSPKEALLLATRLCQITKNQNSSFLVTKALAQANLQEFQNAERTLQTVLKSVPRDTALYQEAIIALAQVAKKEPIREDRWELSDN